MSSILVSVIISTYNSEKFIKQRIDNLISQTISDKLEIVIINSGSEQNEEAIINNYLRENKNIKYLKTLERETIYKAWNRGIKLSDGKYITNANTDDRLREDALEILSDALESNSDIAIVYADQYITSLTNATFKDVDKDKKFNRQDYTRLKQLSGYMVGPQSMWRASLHFKDNIWFDENFEVSGDNDFVCRVAEKYDLMRVPGVLGIYYLANDDSNKEFRNYNKTHVESLEIREKYLRRYLKSLSSHEIKKFKKKIWFYRNAPFLIRIIQKIISVVNPSKQILSREFVFLIASTIEEINGNNKKAIEYCKAYINNPNEELIKRQHNRLLAHKEIKDIYQ